MLIFDPRSRGASDTLVLRSTLSLWYSLRTRSSTLVGESTVLYVVYDVSAASACVRVLSSTSTI